MDFTWLGWNERHAMDIRSHVSRSGVVLRRSSYLHFSFPRKSPYLFIPPLPFRRAYIGYQVIKELWGLVVIGRKESFAVEDIHGASTECMSPGNSLKGLLTKAPRSSEHRAPWSHSPRLRCSGLPQIFGRMTRNKNIKTRRTNITTNNSPANEGLVTNYVSSYYFALKYFHVENRRGPMCCSYR
jgi:hypothetical protein